MFRIRNFDPTSCSIRRKHFDSPAVESSRYVSSAAGPTSGSRIFLPLTIPGSFRIQWQERWFTVAPRRRPLTTTTATKKSTTRRTKTAPRALEARRGECLTRGGARKEAKTHNEPAKPFHIIVYLIVSWPPRNVYTLAFLFLHYFLRFTAIITDAIIEK